LLLDAGDVGRDGEQFEGGFDSPRSGSQTMDAFGRWFLEAGGNGCLERQALTEKYGHGLRHRFTLRIEMQGGALRTLDRGKVARNLRNEWVFS
jgi:hypothetical protein